MIEFVDVGISAGAFHLSGISFQVPTGCYGVLMGKTGCGKTTLLEVVCRLRTVRAGDVRLFGESILNLEPAECGVGYVPQDLALFPQMDVQEHLSFALRIRGAATGAIAARVAELADMLGIGHLLKRYPKKLSGGEAQRVALGRALSFHPRVLLLDEPLSALDDETRQAMFSLLRKVQHETGVTTLHVTHNREEAAALGELVLRLEDGRMQQGSASHAKAQLK